MHVHVYMIATGGDLPIGTAINGITLISLIELAKLKGASGVSLHGPLETGSIVSGEMSINDAFRLAQDQVPRRHPA